MRSALQRLRIAAATNDVVMRDERGYVVLVASGHPRGLGIAVEVRGDRSVRLPDEHGEAEDETSDADFVIDWVRAV